MRKLLLFALCAPFNLTIAYSQSQVYPLLKEEKPESVGFSSERLRRIDTLFAQFVDNHWVNGVAAIVVHRGKIVYYKAIGYDDLTNHVPMQRDEIFRIASQTKAVTSVAVMMLYEQGKFLLDDPISKYIPGFKNPRVLDTFNEKDTTYTTVPAKREITIRDLLTHTSGIGYAMIGSKTMNAIYAKSDIPSGLDAQNKTLATEMKKLAILPLAHQPGEQFTYSLGIDVLGYLVELESGMSLDQFFQKKIFGPLHMWDTYFYIPKEKRRRLASLYMEDSLGNFIKAPERISGLRSNYPILPGTYYSGGAGLSSTPYDYAIFLQMLLNGGTYGGTRILSRNSVRMMTMNQIGNITLGDDTFGLGFEVTTQRGSAKFPMPEGCFSWGGYFGTTYWADPKEKIVAQIMTQINPANYTHSGLADKFKVAVYQALDE